MKSYKSKICLPVLAFAFAGLMGCGSLHYPKAHHKEIDKNVHSFSYTADLRATHVIKKGDRYWILTEPPPDAAFSYDDEESMDLDLSLISIGKGGQGKEGVMSGSEDLPLTGRASYVVLARELCYRVNEMAFNTDATYEQYMSALDKAFQIIQGVAAVEAVNIQHSAQVHINTGVTSALSLQESVTDAEAETMSSTKSSTETEEKTDAIKETLSGNKDETQ